MGWDTTQWKFLLLYRNHQLGGIGPLRRILHGSKSNTSLVCGCSAGHVWVSKQQHVGSAVFTLLTLWGIPTTLDNFQIWALMQHGDSQVDVRLLKYFKTKRAFVLGYPQTLTSSLTKCGPYCAKVKTWCIHVHRVSPEISGNPFNGYPYGWMTTPYGKTADLRLLPHDGADRHGCGGRCIHGLSMIHGCCVRWFITILLCNTV
jgi:hypothetical protein